MKLIIDIPKEKYLYAKNLVNSGKENNPVVLAIGSGTPIPDNATNGDVIRTIFDPKTSFNIELHCTYFWWNAPYQKGGKK